MIKQLKIENLILIDSATIDFAEGLNILSGETGSGKSAIIHAISLLSGEKGDTSLIRYGEKKCIVEGSFKTDKLANALSYLHKQGVEIETDELLVIRRELSSSGKSRSLINHQLVSVTVLKFLSTLLFHLTSQRASHQLIHLESHRRIVDVYGETIPLLKSFTSQWEKEQSIKKELEHLLKTQSQRYREIEMYQREIEEIENAKLKEGEEETLFEEYTLLVSCEERSRLVKNLMNLFSDDEEAILINFKRIKNLLEQMSQLDPELSPCKDSFKNIFLETEELVYTFRKYQSQIEYQPERVDEINERLTLINGLKKRYGNSVADIQNYLNLIKSKLSELENSDLKIEQIQSDLKQIEALSLNLCQKLTLSRSKAAQQLQEEITAEIQKLNMSQARFVIKLHKQARNQFGEDSIEFFFLPNAGESEVSVRNSASGGEISRITLAIQALLAGKEEIPSLIFDEIDSNIGGETAKVIGETLKKIAHQHQILCITHFPQVAKFADHHLNIFKVEEKGRTFTKVKTLSEQEKQAELTRMVGG